MKRYELIDTLRGLAILSMIAFHTCWLLNLFGLAISTGTLYGPVFTVWERSICISFILISGFCFSLGRDHIRSGLIVFGTGLAITVITCVFMPEIRIVFGVLTFIGSAILLMIPVDRLIRGKCERSRAFRWSVLIVSFAAFLFTYNINLGYLGFGAMSVYLPKWLYRGYLATYIGFLEPGFRSTDYFSLIPWFFLYACGYVIFMIIKEETSERKFMEKGIPFISAVGRHSLVIYVVHPVVIYGILYGLSMIL